MTTNGPLLGDVLDSLEAELASFRNPDTPLRASRERLAPPANHEESGDEREADNSITHFVIAAYRAC